MRKLKRIKKKKSLYQKKAFWVSLLSLCILGFFAYALFLSPWFMITRVEAQGGDAKIEETIGSRVALGNLFLFDSAGFLRSLKESFPEITDIKVQKRFPQTLSITFQKRTGVAAWCKTKTECFLVDANGVVFVQKTLENELLVLFAASASPGEQLMEQERWSTLLDFKKRSENLSAFHDSNLGFRSVDVVSTTRANWKTFEGWEVYANLEEDLEWQLLKLQAVLEKKIPPSRRPSLLYIDLRFGDQAYVN